MGPVRFLLLVEWDVSGICVLQFLLIAMRTSDLKVYSAFSLNLSFPLYMYNIYYILYQVNAYPNVQSALIH